MDACFHYFTGKRMKWWEFWGYNGCNANPTAQKAFEEYSGIRFRPAMLFASLDGPAINYTPTPEIRAWMKFNQKLVTDFMKKVSDTAKTNGIMYQFYWKSIDIRSFGMAVCLYDQSSGFYFKNTGQLAEKSAWRTLPYP